jgi:hypothetical protein
MPTVIAQLCIDTHDPLALARWWAEVLGWATDEEEGDDSADEIAVVPPPQEPAAGIGPGGPAMGSLLFLRVPDDKIVKNRLHIDLRPTDGSSQEAELARLLAHGARRIDVGQGPDATWHVLADPEGNEFCLLRSTPARLAELVAAED